eukprot:gene11954-25041_t
MFIPMFPAIIIAAIVIIVNGRSTRLPLFQYPMKSDVWLCGIEGLKDEKMLLKQLEGTFPSYTHQTFQASDDIPSENGFGVEFKLSYSVNKVKSDILSTYQTLLQEKGILKDGVLSISVSDVSDFLNFISSNSAKYFPSSGPISSSWFNIPILLLNGEKLPKHRIISPTNQRCTQSVLSNIAFLDISAEACDLSLDIIHDNKHIKSSSPIFNHPWPLTYASDEFYHWLPRPAAAYESYLISRIISIITSAIQQLTTDYHPQLAVALASAQLAYTAIHTNNNIDNNNINNNKIHNHNNTKLSYSLKSESIPYIDTDILIHDLSQIGDSFIHNLMTSSGYSSDLEELKQWKENNIKKHSNSNNNMKKSFENSNVQENSHINNNDHNNNNNINTDDTELDSSIIWFENFNKDENTDLHLQSTQTTSTWSTSENTNNNNHHCCPLAIIPVFVLSDLHIHQQKYFLKKKSVDSHNSNNKNVVGDDYGDGDGDGYDAIQPLLDKHAEVAVRDNVVIALHASSSAASSNTNTNTDTILSYYSPSAHQRIRRNLSAIATSSSSSSSDANSLIAQGLATALTGLTAPHLQRLATHDIIDLTWTHGDHPFPPFGKLNDRPFSGVVTWAGKRACVVSRLQLVMDKATAVTHQASSFLDKVLTTMLLLQGYKKDEIILPKSKIDIKNEENNNNNIKMSSITGHPLGIFQHKSEYLSNLPTQCTELLIFIEDKLIDLELRILELNSALFKEDSNSMLSLLSSLESSISEIEMNLLIKEKELRSNLLKCKVHFQDNYGNGNSNTKESFIKTFQNSPKQILNHSFIIIIGIFGSLFIIIPILFFLKKVQEVIETKAKKAQ